MSSTVNTPAPTPITPPVNEKPRTVEPLDDTSKPASPAAPPDPPLTEAPLTSNWKPLIAWNGLS